MEKDELTAREKEIAELIAWGASSKDVANQLFLSIRTVENHIRNIHQKIGVQKANELSAWWFCKTYGIDPYQSPLKRIFAILLVGLILSTEFTHADTLIFRTKARTETRIGRRHTEEGESLTI